MINGTGLTGMIQYLKYYFPVILLAVSIAVFDIIFMVFFKKFLKLDKYFTFVLVFIIDLAALSLVIMK